MPELPNHCPLAETTFVIFCTAWKCSCLGTFLSSISQKWLLTAIWASCPKTVFFWAPCFKWGLVIAGIGDLQRPAEKLSVSQSSALAATGLIWSRYSLVIIPKNWSLFSVNVFVAATSLYQLFRAVRYQQEISKESK
ncbi:mitochondrial pyruvate carrier 2-like [Homalodisca vitripennis]|uniref:mitochondrial pyruvate carrier 2-like n=1 Tax=Homalodisca vitripennis TaxID=197043 RepID=UPI001EEA7341|nr:mitochondrial pyruvate carrier 2-like [Homalodisca vitripennis]